MGFLTLLLLRQQDSPPQILSPFYGNLLATPILIRQVRAFLWSSIKYNLQDRKRRFDIGLGLYFVLVWRFWVRGNFVSLWKSALFQMQC